MSKELFEVLSLAARYLFALLCVIIVLRAFLWLLSDHADRQQRLRQLPNAGMIGELVVLSGNRELREGDTIAVPWEGTLGSVRSADVCVPFSGISRKHLYFTYELNKGMLIQLCSGCEAMADGILLNCHSRPEEHPLIHGSFLQIGQAVLRLRVFAGLDKAVGFGDGMANAVPMQSTVQNLPQTSSFLQAIPQPSSNALPYPALPENAPLYPAGAENTSPYPPAGTAIPDDSMAINQSGTRSSRRRRDDRWEEVDWSE